MTVPQSVLDAIKAGDWSFEPASDLMDEFRATDALPGSHEKLEILAQRVARGLPLWHPADRRSFDDAVAD
jgi:hypothetical protein